MVLFPALLVLRRRFPDAPRPYRVPGGRGGTRTAVIQSETFVLLGLGLIVTVIPTGGSRLPYTAVTTGSTLATLLVGIWLLRRRAPLSASGADAQPHFFLPIPRWFGVWKNTYGTLRVRRTS